jgi:uncharacterized glyoxalase superfamily protein PhnB
MRPNRSIPAATIIPELAYPDVAEAVGWLCEVFGFRERLRIANHRAQLAMGDGAIVVIERPPESPAPRRDLLTHAVLVRIPDVHRHHERAARLGARILRPPADYPYGERQYTAEDFAGHVWTFSETIADSDPASWGGTLVEA